MHVDAPVNRWTVIDHEMDKKRQVSDDSFIPSRQLLHTGPVQHGQIVPSELKRS